MPRAAVIGAGIAGITTAYMLAQKGYEVDIFERGNIAGECSFANGGQLSVSNSETWNSWSNVIKGMKWMFSKDAPLAMRFDHWSKKKVKWIAEFLAAIPHQEYNTRETIAMALRSRELILQVQRETGIEFDQQRTGIMHIYRSQRELDKAGDVCRKYRDTGWDRDVIDTSVMKQLEPSLNYDGIVGGTFTPGDFTGDVNLFCINLLQWLMDNKSVRLRDQEMTEIKFNVMLSCYDRVCLCTGTAVGEYMPTKIYPIKGYSVTYSADENSTPKVSLLDDAAKIVTSNLGGRLRVAGTAELAGFDRSIRPERIEPLKKWVKNNTMVGSDPVSEYACLRPMNPDMMPTVTRGESLVVNSGAGHLGWTLCMALAEKAANL